MKRLSRSLLIRDVESRESEVREEERRGEWLFRRLFSVLRRGEVRECEKEELERREDEVEDRLEGWREGQEDGCAAKFRSGEWGRGISVEA